MVCGRDLSPIPAVPGSSVAVPHLDSRFPYTICLRQCGGCYQKDDFAYDIWLDPCISIADILLEYTEGSGAGRHRRSGMFDITRTALHCSRRIPASIRRAALLIQYIKLLRRWLREVIMARGTTARYLEVARDVFPRPQGTPSSAIHHGS